MKFNEFMKLTFASIQQVRQQGTLRMNLLQIAKANKINLDPLEHMLEVVSIKYPNATPRYWGYFDVSKKDKEKRFHLFDVEKGTVTNYLCAHGAGTDRNKDGLADRFSNEKNSNCTSLGVVRTAETYVSKKVGFALRLNGLEKTNSNVAARGVVLHAPSHGKDYVSDSFAKKNGRLGNSWGCLVFDKRVFRDVIAKLKGGSFIVVSNDKV